jgi:hypothetical protein
MRVFFTQKQGEVEDKLNIDALDIITPKFRVAIRLSGVEVTSMVTKERLENGRIDLDLSGEI